HACTDKNSVAKNPVAPRRTMPTVPLLADSPDSQRRAHNPVPISDRRLCITNFPLDVDHGHFSVAEQPARAFATRVGDLTHLLHGFAHAGMSTSPLQVLLKRSLNAL